MTNNNVPEQSTGVAENALHGMLQVALLFWKLLSETLQEWGFTLNPYDKCVTNKDIISKQCTIIWHVDNLKISYVNKDVVEDILTIWERKPNMSWRSP